MRMTSLVFANRFWQMEIQKKETTLGFGLRCGAGFGVLQILPSFHPISPQFFLFTFLSTSTRRLRTAIKELESRLSPLTAEASGLVMGGLGWLLRGLELPPPKGRTHHQ